MKKFFYLFCFLSTFCSAQDIVIPRNRIPVQQDGFFAWVQVYEGSIKSSSIENSKTYFWLKAKQVHTSKGGYAGELLDGEYLALYKTDALKEKGIYNKGLKNGEWKEWHLNGEIKRISHWKNGTARGTFLYYNEKGKITRREYYRNGLLHGKQFDYSDSTETFVRYRKGLPVKTKTKSKNRKAKIEKGKEIPAEIDSASAIKSRRPWFEKIKTKKGRETKVDKENEMQPTQEEHQPTENKKPKNRKHEKRNFMQKDHPVQEQVQPEQHGKNKPGEKPGKTEKS